MAGGEYDDEFRSAERRTKFTAAIIDKLLPAKQASREAVRKKTSLLQLLSGRDADSFVDFEVQWRSRYTTRQRWRFVVDRLHFLCTIGALTIAPVSGGRQQSATISSQQQSATGSTRQQSVGNRQQSATGSSRQQGPSAAKSLQQQPPAAAASSRQPAAAGAAKRKWEASRDTPAAEFAAAFRPPPELQSFVDAKPTLQNLAGSGVNITYSYWTDNKLNTQSVTIPASAHELSENQAAKMLELGHVLHILQIKSLTSAATTTNPTHGLDDLKRIAREERSWLHMLLHGLVAGGKAWASDEKGQKRVRPFLGSDDATNGELAALVAAEILKKAADPMRVEPLHLFLAEVLEAHNAPEHVRRLLVDLGMSASRKTVRSRQTQTIGSLEADEEFLHDSIIHLLFDNIGFKKKGKKCSYAQYTLLLYEEVKRVRLDELGISAANKAPRLYTEVIKGLADFMATTEDWNTLHSRRDLAAKAAIEMVAEALEIDGEDDLEGKEAAVLFGASVVPTRPRCFFNGATVAEASLQQHREADDAESSEEECDEDQDATAKVQTTGERSGIRRRECWKDDLNTVRCPCIPVLACYQAYPHSAPAPPLTTPTSCRTNVLCSLRSICSKLPTTSSKK